MAKYVVKSVDIILDGLSMDLAKQQREGGSFI